MVGLSCGLGLNSEGMPADRQRGELMYRRCTGLVVVCGQDGPVVGKSTRRSRLARFGTLSTKTARKIMLNQYSLKESFLLNYLLSHTYVILQLTSNHPCVFRTSILSGAPLTLREFDRRSDKVDNHASITTSGYWITKSTAHFRSPTRLLILHRQGPRFC